MNCHAPRPCHKRGGILLHADAKKIVVSSTPTTSSFSPCLPGLRRFGVNEPCQRINKRCVPIDGNFVDAIIFLRVLPACGAGPPAADEIARPWVYDFVSDRSSIVRVHRRL